MIRLLRQYAAKLTGYIEVKILGNLPAVDRSETVSRFIFQNSHFASKSGAVKYGSFMPPPANLEVSVYRTSEISRRGKWLLCTFFVEPFAGRKAKACANVSVVAILDNSLALNADGIPQRRHANIVGWSGEKSKRMMIAKSIAKQAVLDVKN